MTRNPPPCILLAALFASFMPYALPVLPDLLSVLTSLAAWWRL